MKQIAYLSSPSLLRGAANRRADAFEHDIEVACLFPALHLIGWQMHEISWLDDEINWSQFDAVIVRTVWDYSVQPNKFLNTIASIAEATHLLNPFPTIKWNIHKSYLLNLQERGVKIVPTRIHKGPLHADVIREHFIYFDTNQLVVKKCIGACAEDQYLMSKNMLKFLRVLPNNDWIIQPYEPSIVSDGELSLIFLGHQFSHGLRKTPAPGDYRVQSIYGGIEEFIEMPDEALEVAKRAISNLPEGPLLYSRIDILFDRNKEYVVSEVELIDPYLYPNFSHNFGERFAEQLSQMMTN